MSSSIKRYWTAWWQSSKNAVGWVDGTRETADGKKYIAVYAVVDASSDEEVLHIVKSTSSTFDKLIFCTEQVDKNWLPTGNRFRIEPDWEPLTIESIKQPMDLI